MSSLPSDRFVQIEIAAIPDIGKVLNGLKILQDRSPIVNIDLRFRAVLPYTGLLRVTVEKKTELLEALYLWVELGLISPEKLRDLCCTQFVCAIPDPVAPQPSIGTANVRIPSAVSVRDGDEARTAREDRSPQSTVPAHSPNWAAQIVRSLVAEFSLAWLLFLGVFLVVVSSGVLAATQWDRFLPQGQYLILFAYTLAFWGASIWTGRQENLFLTARTLKLVALLIVPANFWAIDGLGLLSNPVGMLLGAIAGIVLSGITIALLQGQTRRNRNLTTVTVLLLSWLHLGWGWGFYPVIAVYLGTVGSAVVTLRSLPTQREESSPLSFPLGSVTTSYALLLLLARALFLADVAIVQLGLAFGLCGWILCWTSFKIRDRKTGEDLPPLVNPSLGAALLVLGWLVSVGVNPPWQAIAVSCLGLWLLGDRLIRAGTRSHLTAIFLLGLQVLWLCGRAIPPDTLAGAIAWLRNLLGTKGELSLLGIAVIPYVWLTLWLANLLRQRRQQELAQHAEGLALGLGLLLAELSSFDPSVRSLNLVLSTVTLFTVQAGRSQPGRVLIYLTHISGLVAIAAIIDRFLPNLHLTTWAGILLAGMLGEWIFVAWVSGEREGEIATAARLQRWQIWRDSAWHLGLCLAALSYVLLAGIRSTSDLHAESANWGLAWAIVPLSLTYLGDRRRFVRSQLATHLSIVSLLLWQLLTWQLLSSLQISLGIATALMSVNTRRNQTLGTALLTVGFGFSAIAALLWQFKGTEGLLDLLAFCANGLVLSAMILFLLSHWLKHRRDPSDLNLNQVYAQSFDIWAILISLPVFLLQTFLMVTVLAGSGLGSLENADLAEKIFIQLSIGVVLITGATIYRVWREPVTWVTWGTAWGIELLVTAAIALTDGTMLQLGIINLALGLLTQVLGDWWLRQTERTDYPFSWHIIPLIYGILGWLFHLGTFDGVSGLFSLGMAAIAAGIGRRASAPNPAFKLLTYLAVVAITLSAYELLVYQLSQSSGGSLGDRLVLAGMLGAAIALAYRLFARWIMPFLKLNSREIEVTAHTHWFASTGLLLVAIPFQPSPTGGSIGCAVMVILAGYAIPQARNWNERADSWVYGGVVLGIGAIAYILYFAFPESRFILRVLQPYAAAIACTLSLAFYTLPWEAWGWSVIPWRRSAYCLPLAMVVLTVDAIAVPTLLIVATFYAAISRASNTIRLSYLSAILSDWALFRFYRHQNLTHPLWYAFMLGMSALYIVQVEPNLQMPQAKEERHILRLLAVGSICLTGVMSSFSGDLSVSLITAAIGIGFILAGLALHVQAYLYVGTVAFISVVLIQVWMQIARYSFSIWAILICAGIAIILIVGSFEARRERILALWRGILLELAVWE